MWKTQGLLKNQRKNQGLREKTSYPKVRSKNPRSLEKTQGVATLLLTKFDMSCAQAHWVGSKPIRRVMQLKLHKSTTAIGYLLRMCAQNVDSTNPGRSKTDTGSRGVESAFRGQQLVTKEYTYLVLL